MTARSTLRDFGGLSRIVRLLIPLTLATQVVFAAAALVSLLLSAHMWAADMANFLRPHMVLAGAGLCVFGFALPSRLTRAGGVLAFVAAAVPFFLLPPPASSAAGTPISVVSANIYVDNPDPSGFLAIPAVASADIVVLQEMTPLWQDALVASGLWRHESSRDLEANTDMKLFSRFPVLDERTVSSDSVDTGGRYAVRYELLVDDRRLIVYAVHPQTPRTPSMWRERSAYLRDLAEALKSEPPETPVVVAGDWNTPSWSPFFRDLLASTGYRTTESRWWPSPTRFSTRYGSVTQLGTPIDRVILSPSVGLEDLSTGPTFGSNHLPVIARLSIP